ncbi:CASTOR/POLLUX-related putative ion channel [Catenovulum sediminis]|uniref:CASTOR/POLLUX/SYM8 ion channel conserved domain-containing protein n=1 Tax=Catenovulum sediminis TaxID=1740262 RepID=A0ABV1RHT7_9ALTE|nr:hypothetical protein [Catenovulum sediminis]
MSLKFTYLQPIDRIKYFVERQLVKGAGYQLFVIVACIALVSLIGGMLLTPISTQEQSLADDIWWAFLRLTDPGYLGDDEGAWRRIVSTILTICGYVLFMGTLVAIMTRWLIAFMEKLEQGLTPVSVKDHIVLLGMSSRTVPIIRELLGVEANLNVHKKHYNGKMPTIILLAEEVNAIVHQQLLAEIALPHKLARQVILRSGKALQSEALHRVACLDASSVILTNQYQRTDSLVTTDVETIKSLLTINVLAQNTGHFPRLVVELDDVRHTKLAKKSYQGQANVVVTDETISRLMAQCAVAPNLLKVYTHLLNASSKGRFFLKEADEHQGKTVAEAKLFHSSAILVGYIDPQNQQFYLALGEHAKHKIVADDILVFIASNYNQLQSRQSPVRQLAYAKSEKGKTVATQHNNGRKKLLLLGWNRRVPNIIHELDDYQNESFDVTLVSTFSAQIRQQEIAKLGRFSNRINISLQEADYMMEAEIRQFKPEEQDIILLVYSDRLDSADEADARVLVGAMVLDEILDNYSKKPHVLIELSDPANENFLDQASTDTFITPLLMSHLLSQIALMPENQILFDTLTKADGIQIYLRSLKDYSDKEMLKSIDVAQLVEAHGEIFLGVFNGNSAEHPVQLNLPPEQRISTLANDLLIVIGNGL